MRSLDYQNLNSHSFSSTKFSVCFYMIGFQGSFYQFVYVNFALALACTAITNCIGAAAGGNTKLAAQFLPLTTVPPTLFAGFFVRVELIPIWIRWLRYLYPLTYAVKILLVEEFDSCRNNDDDKLAQYLCTNMLDDVDAHSDHIWRYWLALAGQFVAYRLLALWLLRSSVKTYY